MIWFRGRKNCQRISENRRIKRSRESGFSLTRYLLSCAYGVPIGMIFVPSVKGISHQGDEYTKPEHIDLGADVLYQTVLKLDENGV